MLPSGYGNPLIPIFPTPPLCTRAWLAVCSLHLSCLCQESIAAEETHVSNMRSFLKIKMGLLQADSGSAACRWYA